MNVPFFRPDLADDEIAEVVAALRSGWLTTGPRVAALERRFAQATGGSHCVAMNSCTAAMHVATVALGLGREHGVLVPTMTFAATAEIVRYAGAVPILVDCDPKLLHLDLADAENKIARLRSGELLGLPRDLEVVGIIPVHVGGVMLDMDAVTAFARRHRLWVIEDAAHSFPAAYRTAVGPPESKTANSEAWRRCGEGTSDVACFSFYANKTITTGEGGAAVCDDEDLAARMRSLSLHGLSSDAWGRYTAKGSWDYRILVPGYKYNLTDIAAALGLRQLDRAEPLRRLRERVARRYLEAFSDLGELELPLEPPDRLHSWHLFQLKLHLDRLIGDRDEFLAGLRQRGIGYSVHWRPLHLHPYYEETYGWHPLDLPQASAVWQRTVTLPLFPAMHEEEVESVIDAVRSVCSTMRRRPLSARSSSASAPATRPDHRSTNSG